MWGQEGNSPWSHPQQQVTNPMSLVPPPNQPPPGSSQWSLNPTHYANIPHNQVDWAALAQQWIVMKGQGVGGGVGDHNNHGHQLGAPLHQNLGIRHGLLPTPQNMYNHNNRMPFHHLGLGPGRPPAATPMMMTHIKDEGPPGVQPQSISGDIIEEAPMELETPLDLPEQSFKPGNTSFTTGPQNTWLTPESNNPWNANTNNAPRFSTPPPTGMFGLNPSPRLSTPSFGGPPPQTKQKRRKKSFNPQSIPQQIDNSPSTFTYGYSTGTTPSTTSNIGGGGGYWSSSDSGVMTEDISSSQYSASTATTGGYSSDENSMPDFDAAKRKTLPIWIREGLEKMERDKKRKEEEARLEIEREEMRQRRSEEQARLIAEDPEAAAQLSKWNGEESQPASSEDEGGKEQTISQQQPKPESLVDIIRSLSAEEKEEAIMYAIRRASTTVLVKVTNQIISEAASAALTHAKSRKKVTSSTMQIKKTSALASISGALGLAVYGSDDSDDSDGSEDDDDHKKLEKDLDSEEELIAVVEKKKREWEFTKSEIERKLDLQENSSRGRSRSRSAMRDSDPGASSPKKILQHNNDSNGSSIKKEVEMPKAITKIQGDEKDRNGGVLESKKEKRDRSKSPRKERNKDSKYKHRSRSRSKSPREKDKKMRHSRSRSTSKHRHNKRRSRSSSVQRRSRRSKSKDSRRSRSKDRRRSRSKDSRRSRSKDRRRSRSKDSRRSRSKDSRRSRSKDRRRSRSKDSRRSRSKDRRRRSISKDKRRSKSKEKRRSRSKEKRRSRSKEKRRSRSKDRRRSKSKEKRRSRSKDRRKSSKEGKKKKASKKE